MIYTVTLNPALDKTVVIPSFAVDQVNRITGVRLDPGGKGVNVSKVIANLGGTSLAVVALGGTVGKSWKQLLQDCGFALHVIPAAGETRTNIKIMDPVGHTNTDINEPGAMIAKEVLEEWIGWMQEVLQSEDILVLSGSVPSAVGTDIYARLVKLCGEKGIRTIVDAEGALLVNALKGCPFLVKPNYHELAGYVGHELYTVEELVDAAKQMLAAGAQNVLVSLGNGGAVWCWCEENGILGQLWARAPHVQVVSTVGAGDSMVGAVAFGLEQKLTREDILRLAVASGTAAVTCDGSQAPTREQILEMREAICDLERG